MVDQYGTADEGRQLFLDLPVCVVEIFNQALQIAPIVLLMVRIATDQGVGHILSDLKGPLRVKPDVGIIPGLVVMCMAMRVALIVVFYGSSCDAGCGVDHFKGAFAAGEPVK